MPLSDQAFAQDVGLHDKQVRFACPYHGTLPYPKRPAVELDGEVNCACTVQIALQCAGRKHCVYNLSIRQELTQSPCTVVEFAAPLAGWFATKPCVHLVIRLSVLRVLDWTGALYDWARSPFDARLHRCVDSASGEHCGSHDTVPARTAMAGCCLRIIAALVEYFPVLATILWTVGPWVPVTASTATCGSSRSYIKCEVTESPFYTSAYCEHYVDSRANDDPAERVDFPGNLQRDFSESCAGGVLMILAVSILVFPQYGPAWQLGWEQNFGCERSLAPGFRHWVLMLASLLCGVAATGLFHWWSLRYNLSPAFVAWADSGDFCLKVGSYPPKTYDTTRPGLAMAYVALSVLLIFLVVSAARLLRLRKELNYRSRLMAESQTRQVLDRAPAGLNEAIVVSSISTSTESYLVPETAASPEGPPHAHGTMHDLQSAISEGSIRDGVVSSSDLGGDVEIVMDVAFGPQTSTPTPTGGGPTSQPSGTLQLHHVHSETRL